MRLKQLHVFYQGNQGIWIIGAARQACSVCVRSVRDLHIHGGKSKGTTCVVDRVVTAYMVVDRVLRFPTE